jgi:hypothetical protein
MSGIDSVPSWAYRPVSDHAMRILTALVVGLGILIVAAAGLLAYGIFTRARAPGPEASAGGRAFAPVGLDLPEGCTIKSVAVSGDNLVIHAQSVGGPDAPAACDRVIVVDAAQGRILGIVDARGTRP